MTTAKPSTSTAPSLTPGVSALSVATKQTNAMNANASIPTPVGATPTSTVTPSGSGTSAPGVGSLASFIQSNAGNIKAGTEAFQASLRAGTSSINGNSSFTTSPSGVLQATGYDPVARSQFIDSYNKQANINQVVKFENRNAPVVPKTEIYGDYVSTGLLPAPKNTVTTPTPIAPAPPTPYSAVDEYTKLTKDNGIDTLNSRINELSAQEAELQAQHRARVNSTMDEQIPMSVISGRVGEVERQDNERIDAITRQKNSLVSQLQSKNTAISMLMGFHKEDYTMANERFTTQFSQSLQMQNLLRGQRQDAISETDKIQDNNRAMYTTVFNGISNGSVDPTQFTPEMKAQLTTLELKAGLPPGFTEMVRNKNPKADIISQNTTTDNDGKTMLNLVMRDQNTGKITTQNIYTGQGKTANQAGLQSIADSALQVDDGSKGGECGKFVNDILQKNGGSRVFSDSLESKISATNSNTPSVGSAIVMDFGINSNGHVGFVTKVDGGKVWVKSSNMKSDGLVTTNTFNSNDTRIKGYYKPDAKATTAIDKTNDTDSKKLNLDFRDDASKLVGKIMDEGMDFNTAHAQLYSKFSGQLKTLGYTDDQVKQAIHKLLGGK